jgi:hypothetical protein
MKKIITATFLATIISISGLAQEKRNFFRNGTYLLVTAGPSFPFNDFASDDISNRNAGMAKTGLTVDLKLGHHVDRVFGLAANAVYGRYAVDKSYVGNAPGVSIEPWQYYGILAGPMVTGTLSRRASFDFSVLTGAVFVNSPKAVDRNNLVVADSDWSTAVPFKLSADFRFRFNATGYFVVGTTYTYMHPEFKMTSQTESNKFRQNMNAVGINAGIGFSF